LSLPAAYTVSRWRRRSPCAGFYGLKTIFLLLAFMASICAPKVRTLRVSVAVIDSRVNSVSFVFGIEDDRIGPCFIRADSHQVSRYIRSSKRRMSNRSLPISSLRTQQRMRAP
jgi:hypothetical protein